MALITTNILGQNTPAIAATEAQYAEMWAQDAAAMYGYADSSAAATQLSQFTEPPQTTSPSGLTAYESAFAMTVPPPVIAANRAQLATLVATNVFGQNTPAIAATGWMTPTRPQLRSRSGRCCTGRGAAATGIRPAADVGAGDRAPADRAPLRVWCAAHPARVSLSRCGS